MNIQGLVIGKERQPSYCVFRIIGKSRNGWLTCQLFSEQDGRRISDGFGFICKFRIGEMVPFIGGAQ